MSGFNMQRFYAMDQKFEIGPVCEMEIDPQNPAFYIRTSCIIFAPQSANICLNVFQKHLSR